MLQITFKIHKEVTFGQGVFVIGNIPEFGSWIVNSSFRLSWHQDHIWLGSVQIPKKRMHEFKKVEYKYIISSWQNPSNQAIQWEIGDQNRKIDLNFTQSQAIINDDWNLRKLKMHLIIKKNIQQQQLTPYRYSIIGNCSELGNWKIRKCLRLQQNIDSKVIRKLSQKIPKNDIIDFLKNEIVFEVHFTCLSIPMDQKKLRYYFIRDNQRIQIQRHPGRSYSIIDGEKYPHRYAIIDEPGWTGIYDQQNFDKPTLSKITPDIFLGSYLKTEKDVSHLKNLGIHAIYSIQTSEDHRDNGISPIYLQLLCKEYGIIFRTIEIQDRNSKDFVQKSKKAVQQIDELITKGKTTYVYCSAGKYRSPQMVALYLILKNGIDLEDAIKFIQEKHPVAKPNERIIKTAIYHIRKFDMGQDRSNAVENRSN